MTRVITATEFRAKCLGLFAEIERQGGTLTITMRGRPIAIATAFKKPGKKTK